NTCHGFPSALRTRAEVWRGVTERYASFTTRAGRALFQYCDQSFQRQQVPGPAKAADRSHDDRPEHRMMSPGFARVDVGDVHLHRRQPDGGDGVGDRVAVMRVGASVDDDPVGPAPGLLDGIDDGSLTV